MKPTKSLTLAFSALIACLFLACPVAPAHAGDKMIFISFSTKDQNFKTQIFPVLEKISSSNPTAVAVHGFASRNFLKTRGINPEVLDGLDKLFPTQRQIVNEKGVADAETRQEMAEMAAESGGIVYIIGNEKASGVAEEMQLYKEAGVKDIRLLDLAL